MKLENPKVNKGQIKRSLEIYEELGVKTFLLEPNAKTPVRGSSWKSEARVRSAKDDLDEIIKGNYNLAAVTSDSVVGIDLDNKEEKKKGSDTYRRWHARYNLDATLMAKTQSGGYHVYFCLDQESMEDEAADHGMDYDFVVMRNRQNVAPGVDIRASGGYLVAPGSQIDGKEYAWENDVEPENISYRLIKGESLDSSFGNIGPVNEYDVEPTPCDEIHIFDYQWEELCEALTFISPDLPEDEWYVIGVFLASISNIGDVPYEKWHEWSSGSKTKYSKKDADRKWRHVKRQFTEGKAARTINSVYYIAEKYGWKRPVIEPGDLIKSYRKKDPKEDLEGYRNPDDFDENGAYKHAYEGSEYAEMEAFDYQLGEDAKNDSENTKNIIRSQRIKVIPDYFDRPSYFPNFHALVQDILDTTPYKYPDIAIRTALAAISYFMQDKFVTPSGIGLNLYQVCIIETGAGKGAYTKALNDIIERTLDHMYGEGVSNEILEARAISSSGFIRMFSNSRKVLNSKIFIPEEFDSVLSSTIKKNSGGQADLIRELFLKAYDGSRLQGERAKKEENSLEGVRAGDYAFSLFGTCTPSTFRKFLGANIEDGLTNRFAISMVDPIFVRDETKGRKKISYNEHVFRGMAAESSMIEKRYVIDAPSDDWKEDFPISQIADNVRLPLINQFEGSQKEIFRPIFSRAPNQIRRIAALIGLYESYCAGFRHESEDYKGSEGDLNNTICALDETHYQYAAYIVKKDYEKVINLIKSGSIGGVKDGLNPAKKKGRPRVSKEEKVKTQMERVMRIFDEKGGKDGCLNWRELSIGKGAEEGKILKEAVTRLISENYLTPNVFGSKPRFLLGVR